MPPDRDAIEAGFSYEESFASRLGGTLTPGSGNTPRAKLDVGVSIILASLKWTGGKSYRVTEKDILEAIAGAQGPGGKGDMLPALAIRFEAIDEEWMAMRVSDLLAILKGEIQLELAPSKKDIKRARAMPAFMREGDDR